MSTRDAGDPDPDHPTSTDAGPPAAPVLRDSTPLVWLDMEMTGLDPEQNVPIEIATLVTTPDLEIIAEGPRLVIRQPESVLAAMDEWNTKHHGESGLTDEVRASHVDCAAAERLTLAFLSIYVAPGKSPLCGNSVGQDRRFLVKFMPQLEAFFHYRNVDISTIKELVRRWYGLTPPPKKTSHRALDDIKESLDELRWYRHNVFKEAVELAEPNPEGTAS